MTSSGIGVTSGGKLFVRGGKIVIGDCCCDPPPVDCPNCCITIDWGEFDEDGDLYEAFDGMTVTLVMPTKNSRIVCEDEEVTVRLFFDFASIPGEGELPPVISSSAFKPFVRWDRSWKYVSHTEGVSPFCGIFLEDGLVEWCELILDATAPFEYKDTYEVVLKYDQCWNHTSVGGVQYGDIEAGSRDGDASLITGTFCDSSECCDPIIPCDSCCFYLDPSSYHTHYELDETGNPVFWAENSIGDRIKVRVLNLSDLTYCIGGEVPIELEIKLIPVRYNASSPWTPEMVVTAENWKRLSHTPPVGTGTVVDGPVPPMEIDWGNEVTEIEYNVMTTVPCPNIPGDIQIAFQRGSDGSLSAAGVLLEWLCCDGLGFCSDCWPIVYTQYFFIEVSESNPYVDLSAEVPPLTDCGELYYHGRVRDTVFDPYGQLYWTHLWLVKACFWEEDGSIAQQELDYAAVLQTWGDGLVAFTAANVGIPNFGVIEDFYVAGMKAAKLTTPEAPNELVEDLIDIPPTPCDEKCREDCDP